MSSTTIEISAEEASVMMQNRGRCVKVPGGMEVIDCNSYGSVTGNVGAHYQLTLTLVDDSQGYEEADQAAQAIVGKYRARLSEK